LATLNGKQIGNGMSEMVTLSEIRTTYELPPP
jgi:hypothetical protein